VGSKKEKKKGTPRSSTVIFLGKTFAAFPQEKVGFKFDYVFFFCLGKSVKFSISQN
jgi:hypothetical protein